MVSSRAHLTGKLQSRIQPVQIWMAERPAVGKRGSKERCKRKIFAVSGSFVDGLRVSYSYFFVLGGRDNIRLLRYRDLNQGHVAVLDPVSSEGQPRPGKYSRPVHPSLAAGTRGALVRGRACHEEDLVGVLVL